jgi:hypothetical protein
MAMQLLQVIGILIPLTTPLAFMTVQTGTQLTLIW